MKVAVWKTEKFWRIADKITFGRWGYTKRKLMMFSVNGLISIIIGLTMFSHIIDDQESNTEDEEG